MANTRKETFESTLESLKTNVEGKLFRLATNRVEELVAEYVASSPKGRSIPEGRFESIMKMLGLLEKENPKEPFYKILKARLFYNRNDYSNADVQYKKAMAVAPDNAGFRSEYNGLLARGSVKVGEEKFLSSPRALRRAPQQRPDQWRIKASPANQGMFSEKERAEKRARLPAVPSVRLSPNVSKKYKK